MADSYRIYDSDSKVGIEIKPSGLADYTDTKFIDKQKFAISSSGTNVLIYNKYTTFPTTDNYYMIIPYAEIAYPVAANAAGVATAVQEFSALTNDIRATIRKNSAGTIFENRRFNVIEGANVTLTVTDDPTNNETDITIAASGGVSDGDKGDITVSGGGATWTIDSDVVQSGTYTPTLYNVANLDSSASAPCQYSRIRSTVTVSGKFSVNPTATATLTQLGIDLPIASAFTAVSNCGGTAFASNIAGQGGAILADATNDRAELNYISSDVTNQAMYFTFTYIIL